VEAKEDRAAPAVLEQAAAREQAPVAWVELEPAQAV
jgi:hypothetical protein